MGVSTPGTAQALAAALARAQRAAADPQCARWLGPVAPGATMAGGARVPGLCHELDPVQAAFNLGVMLAWPIDTGNDADTAPRAVADIRLAALLAAGDWWARRQRLLAARLPTVGDLQRAFDAGDVAASPASAVLRLLGEDLSSGVSAAAGTGERMSDDDALLDASPQHALRVGAAAAQAVRIALLQLRHSGALEADSAAPTVPVHAREAMADDPPLDIFITGLCGT